MNRHLQKSLLASLLFAAVAAACADDADPAPAPSPAPTSAPTNTAPIDPGKVPAGVFLPPTLACTQPTDGPPGASEGGKVCTWSSIAGCTEPGRRFSEQASCETVLTQRPYWSAPPSDFQTPADDPVRSDPAYQTELAWVKEQTEACGCICCHSSQVAPKGKPSNWFTEAEGIWTDSFKPTGLALAAGWVDSSALGAYPAGQNNGFSRDQSGLPSTDPARMVAFFEGELARRGLTREDFAKTTPFGGPIYTQTTYQPKPCAKGEGVKAGGAVEWSGGAARYVYILEAGAKNPGVPPNFDLPQGTLWRLDVLPSGTPVASGLRYGDTPAGSRQVAPAQGAPPALTPGSQYYIYVLLDVGLPTARCLFTAE